MAHVWFWPTSFLGTCSTIGAFLSVWKSELGTRLHDVACANVMSECFTFVDASCQETPTACRALTSRRKPTGFVGPYYSLIIPFRQETFMLPALTCGGLGCSPLGAPQFWQHAPNNHLTSNELSMAFLMVVSVVNVVISQGYHTYVYIYTHVHNILM